MRTFEQTNGSCIYYAGYVVGILRAIEPAGGGRRWIGPGIRVFVLSDEHKPEMVRR